MMKRLKNIFFHFFLIQLLVVSRGLTAQTSNRAQHLFDQANRWYAHQQYDSAILNYQKLIDSGFQNSELFYNAGNAYYQTHQTGLAILNFEKALQQDPGNPNIRQNLHLANQRVKDPIEIAPPLLFQLWWMELLTLHSLNGWVWGSLIFLWALALCLGCRIGFPNPPRWTFGVCVVLGLLFLLYFLGAIVRYQQVTRPGYAIVMVADLDVKTAPDSGSPDLAQIHEGVKVKLLDLAGGWEKVELPNGKIGWVAKGALGVI
ncbi:MAG: SH3 domain-containing protein [Chitinophagaceae bacterium]